MLDVALIEPAARIGALLRERGETVAVAEGSAGGLVSAAARLDASWGLGEAGAAGPANPYGDPAGHCWVAVTGRVEATRHVLTGLDERESNMVAFAAAAVGRRFGVAVTRRAGRQVWSAAHEPLLRSSR